VTMAEPRVSIIIPAYNEGKHIIPVLDRLFESVRLSCEVLVVVDDETDSTVAVAKVAVVTMADGCDDSRQIDDLARLVERGVAVAAASRYMAGGQQVGGPLVKGMLSRTAGRSLRMFARLGTRDATNSFKAYSTSFVHEVGIDSRDGFEIGIELTAKAKRLRLPVAEIPTIWLDRPTGVSSFRVAEWIPKYMRWYRFAFGGRLTPEQIRARGAEKGR
jgi:dolichol-phosphate mannosyltransferase